MGQPALTLDELLSLGIQVLGFLALVVSVLIVFWQTRKLAAQVKANVFQLASGQIAAANRIFIDFPEIRPYFYDGVATSPADPHYQRACAVAEYLLDFYTQILDEQKVLTGAQSMTFKEPYWTTFMVDAFSRSPILCQRLDALQASYLPRLSHIETMGLEQRQAQRPARADALTDIVVPH